MLDKSGYYIRRGGTAHTCPAGKCHSTNPGFHCPHQTGAPRATERAAPAAATLTAEVIAAFTAALGAAATRQRAAQTRRAENAEAAFGSAAYRQQHRRPW